MKAVTKAGQDFVEASYKTADGSIVTGQWESLDAEPVAVGLLGGHSRGTWARRTTPAYIGAPPKTRTSDTSRGSNSHG